MPPGGRILEIGCGTGRATVPFTRQGCRVLCIELGENLAAGVRHKLAAYAWVEVCTGAFEDWPEEGGVVDLAVSAEAFHWLDQTNAYRKIVRALQPGGTIALFWNRHVQSNKSEGFFEAAHEIYRREAPELVKEHPLKLPAQTKSRAGRGSMRPAGSVW
jgi:cyclopropane fatty-acyl-phospholipid synthase-like methyltransferase